MKADQLFSVELVEDAVQIHFLWLELSTLFEKYLNHSTLFQNSLANIILDQGHDINKDITENCSEMVMNTFVNARKKVLQDNKLYCQVIESLTNNSSAMSH